MKYFLHEAGDGKNQSLLIFFNGWGMDENPILPFAPTDRDLLIISDYRILDFEYLFGLVDNYSQIDVMAWSMGILAAQEALADQRLSTKCHFSLAINSTLQPIHDEYGISIDVYELMLAEFSTSLGTFYKGMCLRDLPFFLAHKPTRTAESQLEELELIFSRKSELKEENSLFDAVLMCRGDKIIPYKSQKKYWRDRASLNLPLPHYPFRKWSDLMVCLEYCKEQLSKVESLC